LNNPRDSWTGILAPGIVCLAFLAACQSGGAKNQQITFTKASFGDRESGHPRVLVAYASRTGSTVGVAEAIGKELARSGAAVDVSPVDQVKELKSYQAVVLGSAVRYGEWLPEAVEFVRQNKALLSRVPVAYFLVCMKLHQDTPENRQAVRKYLETVRLELKPIAEGYFAGKLDYSKLSGMMRFILKTVIGAPEGDYRDWDAIRKWSAALFSKL